MAVNTLTNRSSRFGSVPSPGKASRLVNYGNGSANADDVSVKSNYSPGMPRPWYSLPCFRFRNTKSAALASIATAAIFISTCSAFIAYQSLSSISLSSSSAGGHFILPSARDWGIDRERRILARQERRASSSQDTAHSQVKAVKYSEYETNLLNYLFTLRAEGVRSSILPLTYHEPIGQDMGTYANLGCSIFNQLKFDPTSKTPSPKDQMRQIWSSHLSSILAASRHADDPSDSHKTWTKTLLKSLSPYSILDHLPNDNKKSNNKSMASKDIERIIGILVRRFLGLLQNSAGTSSVNNMPPPLRIAVFGGPTVEGMGCHRARVGLPPGSIMANPAFCAFPYRLEQFLNAILLPSAVLKQLRRTLQGVKPGGDVAGEEFRLVEVINLGEEGTSSEFSNAIIRNRMYPPLSNAQQAGSASATGYGGGPPDLVIDAYGIDDYGEGSAAELQSIYEILSQPSRIFPKGCFRENQKPPPVIIRAVLEEDDGAASSEWQVASSIMTAVLGDAVDDVEEGEMSLTDIQNPESPEMEAGGAFGMAGHVASSWTLAFNLAHAAISHCGSIQPKASKMRNPVPDFSNRCDNGVNPPCTFSFLAGLTALRPAAIASSLMPFIVENTGWQPESDISTGFARKTGLVGTGMGATMTLLFRNVNRPIRRFDVVTLRSTSEAWKDGTVQFLLVTGGDFSHGNEAAEASSEVAQETSFEVSAELIADKSNGEDRHISYHFGLDLAEGESSGQLGSDVLLKMTLTKGSRFKVLGLMLCE